MDLDCPDRTTPAGPRPEDWQELEFFGVLDAAFGNGARFTDIWNAWRRNPGRNRALCYVALCGNTPSIPPPGLTAEWPPFVTGFHSVNSDEGRLQLTVVYGDTDTALRNLSGPFHSVLTGATCPNAAQLARVAAHGGALHGNFCDPAQRAALERAGFVFESGEKASFKRSHTRPKYGVSRPANKDAVVIGAGLAGTAAAGALARRGWNVSLLEQNPHPAGEASGNLSSVFSPMVSKDDGHAARLSRACFFSLLNELRALKWVGRNTRWDSCGVLQLARSPGEEDRFQKALAALGFPESYVTYLSRAEAGDKAGAPAPSGGLFFPEGGWLNPAALCEARILHPSIILKPLSRVRRLETRDGIWSVVGDGDQLLARAPVVVCANAYASAGLAQLRQIHFKKVRGQVTHLPENTAPNLRCVVTRDGYITPPYSGVSSIGATYDFGSEETEPTLGSHIANTARLPTLLDAAACAVAPENLEGRVGFRSLTADRLPLIGPIPDFSTPPSAGDTLESVPRHAGLYGLLGMGSRGALWSTLMGELLACQVMGEPLPLPLDLVRAVDPARFALRAASR